MLRLHLFRKTLSKFENHLFIVRYLKTSSTEKNSCLTSCKQLFQHLEKPEKYRVLDASWYMEKDCYSEHINKRIPNSRFFDLNKCADENSPYPMMLPSEREFEDYVSELGVSKNHHLVIYDSQDDFVLFSACRAWWMFRVFGHENVSILNGGLKRWVHEGYRTVSGDYTESEKVPEFSQKFTATYQPKLVKDFDFIKKNSKSANQSTILEARTKAMMEINDDETDITLKSVPGARHAPFTELLDQENNSIRSKDEINRILAKRNIDMSKEMTSSCEIGLTATILSYCIYYATGKNVPVYDGSLTEWLARKD